MVVGVKEVVELIHTSNKGPCLVFSIALAWCAEPNSLDSLSLQEKKRQGYIHELIDTEERYVEDLQIVLEVMGVCPAEESIYKYRFTR